MMNDPPDVLQTVVIRLSISQPCHPSPSNGPCTTFHLFPFLPVELQDMIWDHAANLSPQIHFFLSHHPPFITWESHQPLLDLIPHRESGAHTRVSLCLACRAARAAVDRQIKTDIRESLMLTPVTSWDTRTTPRAALDMDLETDLVCFGGPDDDGGALWKPASWGEGLWNSVNWGEGRHLLLCTAQRVAVRYKPGWDNPVFGRLPHDVRCPGRWVDAGWQDKAARGFCSRCLARWLEKFLCLEEFYLILDEADLGRTFNKGERKRHWGRSVPEPRAGSGVFYSFGRTYFTPDVSETDAATMEACGVLERMRANLSDADRYYRSPWATGLKMGLLTWRQDART